MLKWIFRQDARKSVNKTLSLFTEMIVSLQKSIDLCSSELIKRSVDIDKSISEKEEVMDALQRAKKALVKLEAFIEE